MSVVSSESESESESDPAKALPVSVFLHVFTFLPDGALFAAAQVSRAWRACLDWERGAAFCAAIERRWRTLPIADADADAAAGKKFHWRSVYVRKARAELLWARGAFKTAFLPAEAFGVRMLLSSQQQQQQQQRKAVCWDVRGNVFVYDVVQKREERRIRAHEDRIWWLAVSQNARSELCVTAANDCTLRVLNLAEACAPGADPPRDDAAVVRTLRGHTSAVWCCDFNEASDAVVSGSDKEELCIWRLSTGERVHTVRCAGVVGWYDVKYVPDYAGSPLVVAAGRQCIALINPETGAVSAILDRARGRLPNFLAATPDVRRGLLYASDTMRRLRVWSLSSSKLLGEESLPGIAECVVIRDNKLYTGIDENGLDFYVRVWALGDHPAEPEHLYDVVVDLPKGSRRLYAVEVLEDAIVCCTQGQQLVVISIDPNAKLPKRKKSKSPNESGLATSSSGSTGSSTSSSSASAISRRSAEQQRIRQQQQLRQNSQPLSTSPSSCAIC